MIQMSVGGQGKSQTYDSDQYWAAREAEFVCSAVSDKKRAYLQALARRGILKMWLSMYAQYYGLDPDFLQTMETQQITLDGEDGERLRFRTNEARSFMKQQLTMATGHRPAFQTIATNDDYASLAQIEMSDAAVTYIYEAKFGEKKEQQVAERAALFAKAWTWIQWDPNAGPTITKTVPIPVQLPDGTPSQDQKQVQKRAGDIVVKRLSPWEVFFEPYASDEESHLWRCVRERRSKWEVAALYPDHAENIRKGATSEPDEYAIEALFGWDRASFTTDDTIVEHFYHDKCAMLPEGRYVVICCGIAVYDGPLPYDSLNDALVELCPNEWIGNSFGYSEGWELCSMNQMLDSVVSAACTNVDLFGKQTLFSQEGVDIDWDALAAGYRAITIPRDASPPQAVTYAEVPAATQWLVGYIHQRFSAHTGMNSVVRGDPDENIKSGQMAALFHSIAMEFNSAWQAAIDGHREGVANAILAVYKANCDTDVMVEIAGNDERPYAQTFKRDRVLGIKRVIVKTANPMLRTTAGKMQIADYLKNIPGAIQTPEQAVEAITTGQVKPIYKATRAELLHIKWENETLVNGIRNPQTGELQPAGVIDVMDEHEPTDPMTGQPNMVKETPDVPVVTFDKHEMHMPEHKAEYYAALRANNKPGCDALVAHMLWHSREAFNMDPRLAQLLQIHVPDQLVPPPSAGNSDDQAPPDATPPQQQKGGPGLGVPIPKPSESPVQPQQ